MGLRTPVPPMLKTKIRELKLLAAIRYAPLGVVASETPPLITEVGGPGTGVKPQVAGLMVKPLMLPLPSNRCQSLIHSVEEVASNYHLFPAT